MGVIQKSPVGWWVNYKLDQWTGPFDTEDEALEAAEVVVPMTYPEFQIVRVMPWERKTIKNADNALLGEVHARSDHQRKRRAD